jgi:hypothetical protein
MISTAIERSGRTAETSCTTAFASTVCISVTSHPARVTVATTLPFEATT